MKLIDKLKVRRGGRGGSGPPPAEIASPAPQRKKDIDIASTSPPCGETRHKSPPQPPLRTTHPKLPPARSNTAESALAKTDGNKGGNNNSNEVCSDCETGSTSRGIDSDESLVLEHGDSRDESNRNSNNEQHNLRSLFAHRHSSTLTDSSRGFSSILGLSDFFEENGLQTRRKSLRESFPLLALDLVDLNSLKEERGEKSNKIIDFIKTEGGGTPINRDGGGNSHGISGAFVDEGTNDALKDFALHLKYLGKDRLDEEAFCMLLDDIGYKRSREGLFDSFLSEVRNASPAFQQETRSIGIQDMRYLYCSEPYKIPHQVTFNTGEVLMSYVESLFRKADVSGDNQLDAGEMRTFLRILFDGREPTESQLQEAMEIFDGDKDGTIAFDEFKSVMLRANVNNAYEMSNNMNETILSTSHTSEEEFVTDLEQRTRSHRAVTHHLLTNLACASFGKQETAVMLLRFLSAYSNFNSHFIDNVKTLLELLDDEGHIEILQENIDEELGRYDEETLLACESMGISRKSVDGVPHRELFNDLVEFLETSLQRSYSKFIPPSVCEKLNEAIEYSTKQGKLGLLAVLYFGSELIVPQIYTSILQGLRNSMGISNEEAKFLILHIDMDQDHATALREIIVSSCHTNADRQTLVRCSNMLLEGRVAFYDALIRYTSLNPMVAREAKSIFDDQNRKWVRNEPVLMSDFTGRPVVFDMCKQHVIGSTVLDVGCGEGYVARRLVGMGASKVVGIDSCRGMIDAAISNQEKSRSEYYVEGDAANLKEILLKTTNKTNLMPGAQFDLGVFDLTVAVFLLDKLTITDMNKVFKDIFALLKPGGDFVFCVPHPFISNLDGEHFGYAHRETKGASYFSLRDKLLEGHIGTVSGDSLKVQMLYKSLEDYMQAAIKHGFNITDVKEARVSPDQLSANTDFFDSVNGLPLQLVVKVHKPNDRVENSLNVTSSANTLTMLPKKITWSRAAMRHPTNAFSLQIPDKVKQELYMAALEFFNRGISVDDIDFVGNFRSSSFESLKSFAIKVRNSLLHETGLVLLKGLDLDVFGTDDSEKTVECSKLAYYIICSHIGAVDGSARGKLFDVKNHNVDAENSDNTLFSVADCEANWHTDGASKDKVYDAVSLLCLRPSSIGGKSRVSNACNAYDSISHMPKFFMNELHRPLCRDILESGKGNKTRPSMMDVMTRVASIMSLRVCYNSYPIFDVQQDRIRFRYMRHWIESAHQKMHWKIPTLLKIAMDVLDDALDEGCCFHERLGRGDMLMCNNACVAHGRDAFKDSPGEPPRHLVRAWMQVQKVDLLKPSNQAG